METNTPIGTKPVDSAARSIAAGKPSNSAPLLTRADFGTFVCGRVEAITPLAHRQGKSEKGKEYEFYQESITLAVSGEMIEVVYRVDKSPAAPLHSFELDQAVRIQVKNPRIYNGKVSFDAAI